MIASSRSYQRPPSQASHLLSFVHKSLAIGRPTYHISSELDDCTQIFWRFLAIFRRFHPGSWLRSERFRQTPETRVRAFLPPTATDTFPPISFPAFLRSCALHRCPRTQTDSSSSTATRRIRHLSRCLCSSLRCASYPPVDQHQDSYSPTRSIYALTKREITQGIANRFVHSRVYILLYLSMTALSVTTIALSITDGCPGLAFYILEIIINTSMITEVTIRLIAFGRVS